MADEITESDLALVELAALAIGTMVIGDPKRQDGINTYLDYLREQFQSKGSKKAAALVEAVRNKATDFQSGPSTINALIERKQSLGDPH